MELSQCASDDVTLKEETIELYFSNYITRKLLHNNVTVLLKMIKALITVALLGVVSGTFSPPPAISVNVRSFLIHTLYAIQLSPLLVALVQARSE